MDEIEKIDKRLTELGFKKQEGYFGTYYLAVVPIWDYVKPEDGVGLDELQGHGVKYLVYDIDVKNKMAEYWFVRDLKEIVKEPGTQDDYDPLIEELMSEDFSWREQILDSAISYGWDSSP